jgi:hypothetical protein
MNDRRTFRDVMSTLLVTSTLVAAGYCVLHFTPATLLPGVIAVVLLSSPFVFAFALAIGAVFESKDALRVYAIAKRISDEADAAEAEAATKRRAVTPQQC